MSRPREDLITVKTGTIDCGVELEPDNVESVSEFGMKRANGKGKELITADERFPPPFRPLPCRVLTFPIRRWRPNVKKKSSRQLFEMATTSL